MDLAIYIIVRGDLDIPPGKLAGQAAHAVEGLYHQIWGGTRHLEYNKTPYRKKIVIRAKNLKAYDRAETECYEARLPVNRVVDFGLTVFPEPTATCLAVGPCKKSELPKYVQRFQLYE